MSVESQLAVFISKERSRIVNAWGTGVEDYGTYLQWLGKWREIKALEDHLAELKRKRGDNDDEPTDDRPAARGRRGISSDDIAADAW
jgi:hypothetical protein